MAGKLSKSNKNIFKLNKNFKKTVMLVGKKILTIGAKIGIKAITLGVIKDTDIESIKDIKNDLASETSITLSKYIEDKINSFAEEKNDIKVFKDNLTLLGESIKKVQSFPLLIIIDELDRCKPDFSLKLIERVKHLFSVENVSFLFLVNIEQLENIIRNIYGNNIDANNYLHKFINITTKLPKLELQGSNKYYNQYINYLSKHHGIEKEINEMDYVIIMLFKLYNFTLREVERFFTIITVYYSGLPNNRFSIPIIIGFLAIVKVKFPDIFYTSGLSYVPSATKDAISSFTFSNNTGTCE